MYRYGLAFLIGAVAGLRSMTAPAAVSWAARTGWLPRGGFRPAFLTAAETSYIATALAAGELVADKLPQIPSRRSPVPFAGRIAMGALCGAAIGGPGGAAAGALGAVAGTLGGYEARTRLARAAGKDLPIALLEDAVAVGTAAAVISQSA